MEELIRKIDTCLAKDEYLTKKDKEKVFITASKEIHPLIRSFVGNRKIIAKGDGFFEDCDRGVFGCHRKTFSYEINFSQLPYRYGIIYHKKYKEKNMAARQEKITVMLPQDLKKEVVEMKDRLKTSVNSIIKEAIKEYVQKAEREKIREEAKEMVEEYKTNPEILEMSDFVEDVIEY